MKKAHRKTAEKRKGRKSTDTSHLRIREEEEEGEKPAGCHIQQESMSPLQEEETKGRSGCFLVPWTLGLVFVDHAYHVAIGK